MNRWRRMATSVAGGLVAASAMACSGGPGVPYVPPPPLQMPSSAPEPGLPPVDRSQLPRPAEGTDWSLPAGAEWTMPNRKRVGHREQRSAP
ncbi:MAG: hypothetical protein AAF928_21755, partial [Myxococcota bacterium]